MIVVIELINAGARGLSVAVHQSPMIRFQLAFQFQVLPHRIHRSAPAA